MPLRNCVLAELCAIGERNYRVTERISTLQTRLKVPTPSLRSCPSSFVQLRSNTPKLLWSRARFQSLFAWATLLTTDTPLPQQKTEPAPVVGCAGAIVNQVRMPSCETFSTP